VGRRLAAFAALGTITGGLWFAACGIDESGTLDTNDGSINPDVEVLDQGVKEVNPEANPPPLTCLEAGTPLDASCLGKPVPTGWQPIAVQVGANVGCGDAGFVSTPLITNPALQAGSCACTGCAATGSWSCGASIKTGNNCTQDVLDASTSACFGNTNHQTYGVNLTRFGNPICGGGLQDGSMEAASTAVTACTPASCDTDFCAMGGQGYALCIYNASVSDGGCPSDFPTAHVVGPSATVACDNCQQCALANPNAQCTGAAIAYSNTNCNGSALGTAAAQTCGDLGSGSFNSVFYDAGPVPVANCGIATGVNTGKVALDQPSTICCP
jgi:hypothetical protein